MVAMSNTLRNHLPSLVFPYLPSAGGLTPVRSSLSMPDDFVRLP